MATIFVSYSDDDVGFVLNLVRILKQNGAPVWMDQYDVAPEARRDRAIEQALRESSHLLVLVSKTSVTAPRVRAEIDFAIRNHKSIIPVLLDEVSLPSPIRSMQSVDFRRANMTAQSYAAALERLLQTLPLSEDKLARKLGGDEPTLLDAQRGAATGEDEEIE